MKQQTSSVSDCVTRKVFSYSLGRDPGVTDLPAGRPEHLVCSANHNIRSLIMQMISTDTFRLRSPSLR